MSQNPTDGGLFRVIFLNEFADGANVDEVRNTVVARFKLSDKAAARMFAGRPVVVKRSVNVETAFQLKFVLDGMGALCHIQTMPNLDDTDDYGYIERRIEEQRERKDRRERMRDEHFVPDRRFTERRDDWPEDDG